MKQRIRDKLENLADRLQELDRLLATSEHKRHQAAPILRVRAIAFGRGRQVPIAARYV